MPQCTRCDHELIAHHKALEFFWNVYNTTGKYLVLTYSQCKNGIKLTKSSSGVGLSCGCFIMQWLTKSIKLAEYDDIGGSTGCSDVMQCNCSISLMCPVWAAGPPSFWKGNLPRDISSNDIPKLHTSDGTPYSWPRIRSGAMYIFVPM